jgi:hypothetical protein
MSFFISREAVQKLAWRGMAWRGVARFGGARRGSAGLGEARQGMEGRSSGAAPLFELTPPACQKPRIGQGWLTLRRSDSVLPPANRGA